MKKYSYENPYHVTDRTKSIEQLWQEIREFTSPISVGVHSHLKDGRPLVAAYATGLMSGSFKERGALAKMRQLSDEGHREAVAYSAGNHAAGCALGARATNMMVKIFVPSYTPDTKIHNTNRLGGESVDLERCNANFEETRDIATNYANSRNLPIIEPFDDMTVGYGQGTVAHELLQGQPDIEHLLVPAGGGGLALGCIEAIRQAGKRVKVYGVKMSSEGELCEGAHVKELGGAAKRVIADNPGLWGGILLVDPSDVGAQVDYENSVRQEHHGAMGAEAFMDFPEATALMGAAAAHKYFDQFDGRVATIITGSNADAAKLDRLHRYYTSLHNSQGKKLLRVASGYQLRSTA